MTSRGCAFIWAWTTCCWDLPSDAGRLIERRRGDAEFEAALRTLEAGPQARDDDDRFNAWQHETAPVGYANWGATEQAHATVGRWSLSAAKAYFSVAVPPDLAARLAEVRAPVLVIAGAEDCLTGLAPVTALARLFPLGKSAVIDQSGHYPWVEQPAAFRDAIDAFLEQFPFDPHMTSRWARCAPATQHG